MRWLIISILFVCAGLSAAAQEHAVLDSTVTIAHIFLHGNKKTKDKIILRELSVQPGGTILTDSLPALVEQNRLRLQTASLFTDIRIELDTLSRREVDLHIHLKERWFIIPELSLQLADRNFNVWWVEHNRDVRRTIIGATLRNNNFRGNLENLSVTAQVGYSQKFYLDYQNPYIDKAQKHGFGISGGVSASQETFFTTDSNKLRFVKSPRHYITRLYEGALAYSYRPAYAARHLVRLSYKHYSISDTILELNNDYFFDGSTELKELEISYRYELNKTDNWNYPLKGMKVIAQGFYRYGLKGMATQTIGDLELGHFKHLGGKWYTASVFRGSASVPGKQPYILRAALGTKYDYVRGYEYYVIDGAHYGVLRFNLKHESLNKTFRNIPFKYLPALPVRIYPKVFADAGYVHSDYPGNSFLNNRMLYSAGVGVDIFTAYDLKVRIEYTWNHLGQKGLFLHFNSE